MIENITGQLQSVKTSLLQTNWLRTWDWGVKTREGSVVIVVRIDLRETAEAVTNGWLAYLTQHGATIGEEAQRSLCIPEPLQLLAIHMVDRTGVPQGRWPDAYLLFRTTIAADNTPINENTVDYPPYMARGGYQSEVELGNTIQFISTWYNRDPHVGKVLRRWAKQDGTPDELVHLLMHKQLLTETAQEDPYATRSRVMCPHQTRDYLARMAIQGSHKPGYLRREAQATLQIHGELYNDQLYCNILATLSSQHVFNNVEELYEAAKAVVHTSITV